MPIDFPFTVSLAEPPAFSNAHENHAPPRSASTSEALDALVRQKSSPHRSSISILLTAQLLHLRRNSHFQIACGVQRQHPRQRHASRPSGCPQFIVPPLFRDPTPQNSIPARIHLRLLRIVSAVIENSLA